MDALILTNDCVCRVLVDSIELDDAITIIAPGGVTTGLDVSR